MFYRNQQIPLPGCHQRQLAMHGYDALGRRMEAW